MLYFEKLREKESSFYKRLWNNLKEIKIIDTHEHFSPIKSWKSEANNNEGIKGDEETQFRLTIPQIFGKSYINLRKNVNEEKKYEEWAKDLNEYIGTGYLRAWMIAIEDLHGIKAQKITPKYLKKVEDAINEAYKEDIEKNKHDILEKVMKNKMHVEKAIVNIDLEAHRELPKDLFVPAAGIPSILEGIKVPSKPVPNIGGNVVYWFAQEKLKINFEDIKTLDDYCEITQKLLEYLKESNEYCCIKMQMAYNRPLWFPEPPDDESEIQKLFNKIPEEEEDLWKFGDYMMHFVLEWTSINWRVPYQIHTGLARMYDGGSNALNLSHIFQKFPDVHFDLFHGNYPYNNLAGMLHQIPNISADLCWLPAISPTAAQRTLIELFEVGDMVSSWQPHVPNMRTCLYGGDSAIVEGSYGALQIAKDVVIRALEDLYNRGHILFEDAEELAKRVLYENPKRIFRF
ncbi:MAG: hypothetical protein ACTSRZ_06520 [Promethearchaeota archaeon]